MTRVELVSLKKAFGNTVVLDGFDLKVRKGEFVALLGPSGCGKTTLLRLLAGFELPECGRILFDDEDVTGIPAHRRNTGMVFQDYALFPDRSVFDNVAYGLRARKVPGSDIRERVTKMLHMVELAGMEARIPSALSGGQRQRVALARALVIEPRVLLLDEPLSNLDTRLRIEMRTQIRRIQSTIEITTLLVTHDQEEALSISDRVVVMKEGKVQQIGPPREVYARPANTFVADFVGAANLLPVTITGEARDGVVTCRYGSSQLQALGNGSLLQAQTYMCARPENLSLVHGDSRPANSVPGVVVETRFHGHTTQYLVELEGGHRIRVDCRNHLKEPGILPATGLSVQFPSHCIIVEE